MEKKKPRILIIEDDEYSREAIEHLLNAKGCEIISMAGGRGAGEFAGRYLVGRFGALPHTESMGYFWTLPTPKPAKYPTFNTVIPAPQLLVLRLAFRHSTVGIGSPAAFFARIAPQRA
jgi:CheY-like chemotaxis protein